MNNQITKNIIYAGFLSGLTLAIICLLIPLAKGMMVWYQLLAVLIAGVIIGLLFRRKIRYPFAISIYGLLYSLAITGIFYFINEKTPVIFSIFVTVAAIFFFLLGDKFFNLKINSVIKHILAVVGFLIVFFVIPVALLLIDRATYTP